jgi:3-keto-L-gulonate-6-phosphate decarboxylase
MIKYENKNKLKFLLFHKIIMNLQVAYDFNDPAKAIDAFTKIIHSLSSKDLYHEVGTPLLKQGGLEIVKNFSNIVKSYEGKIVVDSKTCDVPTVECEKFFKECDADYITAMASSTNENVKEAIELSSKYNRNVFFDLDAYYSDNQKAKRAEEIVRMGGTYINCHTGISTQRTGGTPFKLLKEVYKSLRNYMDSKIVVAGGLNLKNLSILEPFKDKIEVAIVGGAIINSEEPIEQTKLFLEKIRKL